MKKWLLFFVIGLFLFSCTKKSGKEMKTHSGFRYVLYTESNGSKVKMGDYVTIDMVYKNSADSVLFDSRNGKLPLRFQMERIPFLGSFEDGLLNLAINDSATFFVPADSLYNYLYKGKDVRSVVPQEKTGFTPKTYLKFDIKVVNVQPYEKAEVEMLIEQSEEEKSEQKQLNKFIHEHGFDLKPSADGYFLKMLEEGSGDSVDSGKIITIQYTGRFLNGKIFDGTKSPDQPYQFVSGTHRVIKGWELAMKNLKSGTRFTLVLPSRLAYGADGILKTSDATYIVPPNTPVIFDITILSVEEVPSMSGR